LSPPFKPSPAGCSPHPCRRAPEPSIARPSRRASRPRAAISRPARSMPGRWAARRCTGAAAVGGAPPAWRIWHAAAYRLHI